MCRNHLSNKNFNVGFVRIFFVKIWYTIFEFTVEYLKHVCYFQGDSV